MRSAIVTVVVLLIATGARTQPEPPQHSVFSIPPAVDTLDNGLTVVTVPWSTPGIVAYYTLVEVGSRDEVEPGRSGFAHLFEHMMFRGTESLPGDEYQRALQSFGVDSNAFTTNDYTLYTITAPSTSLPRLVEIEADRFQRLHYDEEGFQTETGAVLGEYNTGASSPGTAMHERIGEMAFTEHTYRHTTGGYLRDICAMPQMLDYSRQFFQRYYTPDNTTLIVVGDVTRDALLELVEPHYGGWEGQRFNNNIPVEPEPIGPARAHIPWSGSTPPRMIVAYRVPSFDGTSEDRVERSAAIRTTAALEVIRALAFHESSPLYQHLVVDEQLLMRLSSWPISFSIDPGLFSINAVLRPADEFLSPSGFDPVLETIQEQFDLIASGDVTAERVSAVQSNIRYRLLGRLEAPRRVAGILAQTIAVGGSVDALGEYLDELATLTPEEIAEVASSYLVPERRFVVTLATAAEGEEVPERATCADFENRPSSGEYR